MDQERGASQAVLKFLKREGIKEPFNWYHKDFSGEKEIELLNERQIPLQGWRGQLAWSQSPAIFQEGARTEGVSHPTHTP